MGKILAVFYALVSYALFFITFLYSIGFLGNIIVPKTIDFPAAAEPDLMGALLVDVGLLGIFAIQHSVMARPGFKQWWTKFVPAPIERSTYVLFSTLALALLLWQWRPIIDPVWETTGAAALAITAIFWLGWGILLLSTFMISHFDLFGLRQVMLHMKGTAYEHMPFTTRGFYRLVRHPIMLGFLIAFWAAPVMTLGHLVFAIATTGYILIGVQLEERDLMRYLGDTYADYRARVPMLIPWRR